MFRTGPSGLDARAKVVREIRNTVNPPATISATPSGLAVVGVGLLDNLEANRILLTYLAILFVFLFLSVRLRSIVRALLSLVPVLIAVGASTLFAYVLDLKLSPMTAVGGPLVVAACTEFTSLILLRFVEERRRGLSPRHAITSPPRAPAGRSSSRPSPRSRAWRSSPLRRCPCCATSASWWPSNVAVALLERTRRPAAAARLGGRPPLGLAGTRAQGDLDRADRDSARDATPEPVPVG